MDEQEKGSISKTGLSIQIQDFERTVRSFKDIPETKIGLKTIQTLRNNREVSRLNFSEQAWPTTRIERKQFIEQLKLQKQNLIYCLQVLKTSAVSAIEEKDEQILKLKAQSHSEEYQKIQFYEHELERSKRIRWQLEEEREELHRQMCLERHHSACQLQEKEFIIDELSKQLQRLEHELFQIQQLNRIKERKINLLQQEISELSQQLEIKELSQAFKAEKDNMDLDETLKLNPSVSITKTTVNSSYLFNTLHSEDTEKQLNQTIEEQVRKHNAEMRDLVLFYEKKIQTLYEIIEHDLNPSETKQEEDNCEYRTLVRNNSVRNLNQHLEVSCLSNAVENKQNLDYGHERHESGLETSRSKAFKHILKNEISTFNFSDHTITQYRLTTYEDLEEQAQEQDEEPQYCTKNKSCDTFECEFITERKKSVQQLKQDHNQSKPWQKSLIFAAGLFSGVTLSSLLRMALKQS